MPERSVIFVPAEHFVKTESQITDLTLGGHAGGLGDAKLAAID